MCCNSQSDEEIALKPSLVEYNYEKREFNKSKEVVYKFYLNQTGNEGVGSLLIEKKRIERA